MLKNEIPILILGAVLAITIIIVVVPTVLWECVRQMELALCWPHRPSVTSQPWPGASIYLPAVLPMQTPHTSDPMPTTALHLPALAHLHSELQSPACLYPHKVASWLSNEGTSSGLDNPTNFSTIQQRQPYLFWQDLNPSLGEGTFLSKFALCYYSLAILDTF